MSDKSKIEWTEATWNPVTGCTKVSSGCKHCYAEREWPRMTKLVPTYVGRAFTDVRCHPERLEQPLHWKRPRRIFVNSMSDLFHEDVPFEFIDRVFAVMALAPQHTFQVLTKRPERMREYFTGLKLFNWPLPNVWLGVSVEDQSTADERIPLLLGTPAAVRWISAEPLLGHVDLSRYMWPVHPRWPAKYNSPEEAIAAGETVTYHRQGLVLAGRPFVNWVVVGGESGPSARPMHPQWASDLRDQCAAAGVPFLFKQWGEWQAREAVEDTRQDPPRSLHYEFAHDMTYHRVGKKLAGRLLDGVQHDGYPEVRP